MKTLIKSTAIFGIAMFTLTACAQSWSKGAKGNGKITTETIQVSDYDAVNVVGSMNVTLVKGTEGTITVTTDENLQEYLDITSNGGTLKITFKNTKNGIYSKKGVNITVPFTDINDVSLVGSGDINAKDTIKAGMMDVSLVGSGDINLQIDATDIESTLSGSGDIVLKGSTTNLKTKLSGSGDFEALSLNSDNTDAYVSGSGDIQVYAKKSLKARVNGSGDITYSGNPERVDTKVSGSGDIDTN